MPTELPPHHPDRFDEGYYQRFYGEGGAHDPVRIGHLATAVHEMAAWWGVPVRTMLDVGAGMGMWRDWYRAHHPEVAVVSVDVSEHACATWGHDRRDIADWRPPHPFDLVVCHSVLQYVDDERIERAIDHLATGTRHVLYLELPTANDLQHTVDADLTDMHVYRRTGEWYRTHLRPHFQQAGAGLWVKHESAPMYELESLDGDHRCA